MITPTQAFSKVKSDNSESLRRIEIEMDRRIQEDSRRSMPYAFIIVEDESSDVIRDIRDILIPKYKKSGWKWVTCHPHQHFMVHFTKSSFDEYNDSWNRRQALEARRSEASQAETAQPVADTLAQDLMLLILHPPHSYCNESSRDPTPVWFLWETNGDWFRYHRPAMAHASA